MNAPTLKKFYIIENCSHGFRYTGKATLFSKYWDIEFKNAKRFDSIEQAEEHIRQSLASGALDFTEQYLKGCFEILPFYYIE